MQTLSIVDARQCLGELATRAQLINEVTVLTKHGKPLAKIVALSQQEAAAHETAESDASK